MDIDIKVRPVAILCDYADEVNAVTHPGIFHADEVFATAILSLMEPVYLLRTRDQETIDRASTDLCYVYDVGGKYDPATKRFDHHQADFNRTRSGDNVVYSSAGLIWEHYGPKIIGSLVPDKAQIMVRSIVGRIDCDLICGIDAHDNGQSIATGELTVSEIISSFNPNWCETEGYSSSQALSNECFLEAVHIAQAVLVRAIKRAYAYVTAKRAIDYAIIESADGILELPQYYNGWTEAVLHSHFHEQADALLYGVYRGVDGNWNVQSIPSDLNDSFSQRKPLPEEWRGLRGIELAKVTGVKTAEFCHKNGFIAVAASHDDAIKLARLAVKAKPLNQPY